MKKYNNSSGFTLIELIIVLVILAILAAFTIPAMLGFVGNSKEKLCECSIHTASLLFRTELFTYFLANIDSIYCSICFAMSLSSHLATSF